jgi:hypothetical protein
VVATTVVVDRGRTHGTRTHYRKQSIFGGFEYFRWFIWVVENIVIFGGYPWAAENLTMSHRKLSHFQRFSPWAVKNSWATGS